MSNLKYDGTVTFGNLLQTISLVVVVIGGIWYLSSRQEMLIQQNEAISYRLAKAENELVSVQTQFVRKDVADEHDKVITEKFDSVISILNSILVKLGVQPTKTWNTWKPNN